MLDPSPDRRGQITSTLLPSMPMKAAVMSSHSQFGSASAGPKSTPSTLQRKRQVLLVEDHPIVRQGLEQTINHEPDLQVCGAAESAEQALELIGTAHPDLLLLDISLQGTNGLDVLKVVRHQNPELRVLILSMHDERVYAMRALGEGAAGYVMKEAATENVLGAIRKVLGGDVYLSPQMEKRSMQQFVGRRSASKGTPLEHLSKRELEVFDLIGQGQRTRQIAEALHVSVKTVESHRQHIKEKLGLNDGHELVQHAIQWHQA
jgi:DNA-binding NarL/FixJ family response regulator